MSTATRFHSAVVLVGVIGLLVTGPGAASGQADPWPDPPFQAEIVAPRVELRAGASQDFYAVGVLETGARVRVVSMIGDWLRIAPPPGVYSLIEADHVDPAEGGRTGQVNRNRAPVFAAPRDGSTDSLRIQRSLNLDASVSIVGRVDGYYRIVTPSDVLVFLPRSLDQVRPLTSRPTVPPPPQQPAAEAAQAPQAPQAQQPRPAQQPQQSQPAPQQEAQPQPQPQEPRIDPAEVEAQVTRPAFEATLRADDRFSFRGETFHVDRLEVLLQQVAQIDAGRELRIGVHEDVPEALRRRARQLVTQHGLENVSLHTLDEPTPRLADAQPRPQVDDRVAQADEQSQEDQRYAHIEVEVPLTDPVLAAERRFRAAVEEPLPEQPIDSLIERFEKLAEDEDLPDLDSRLVSARLDDLRAARSAREALERLDRTEAVIRAADDEQPRFVAPQRPASYDFIGRLTTSSVFDGTVRPRLLRLVSLDEGHTIAYIRPEAIDDVRSLLGRTVAVVGRVQRDEQVGVRIIDVRWIGTAPTARAD